MIINKFKHILYFATALNFILLFSFIETKKETITKAEFRIDSINYKINSLKEKFYEWNKYDSLKNLYDSILNDSSHVVQNFYNVNSSDVKKLIMGLRDSLLKDSIRLNHILKNFYITDSIDLQNFNYRDSSHKSYKFIGFDQLTTLKGKELPIFITPPDGFVFSKDINLLTIGEINNKGIYIRNNSSNSHVKLSLWLISQKTDYAPIVNAGPDQTIYLPNSDSLHK